MMEEHIREFLAIEGVREFYCDKIGYETGYTGLALRPGYQTWCLGIIEGTVPLEGDITEELPYAVAPQQACLFFLLLTGTAAVSVLISFGKVFRREILVYAGTKNTGNSR